MRFRHAVAAVVLLGSAAAAAKADSINTYSVQATLSNEPGSAVSGTITIDSTTGVITAEDLTYVTTDDGTFVFDEVDPAQNQATVSGGTFTYATFQDSTARSFFELNTPTLVGYAGGDLCTLDAPCPGSNASNLFEPNGNIPNFQSGTITAAVAVTPEPPALLLLGTGLLGAVVCLRKRLA